MSQRHFGDSKTTGRLTWSFGSQGKLVRAETSVSTQTCKRVERISVLSTHAKARRTSVRRGKATLWNFGDEAIGALPNHFGDERARELVLLISILRTVRKGVPTNLRIDSERRGCPPFASAITDIGFVAFTTSVVKTTANESLHSFGYGSPLCTVLV